MHIVHVIETLDLASGGPATGTPSIAAAQALQGHAVSIICYESPGFAQALRICQDFPGFDRVQVRTAAPAGVWELITTLHAGKLLDTVLADADFLDVHGVWRPILAKAIKIARQRDVPYAVTPHGMLHPWSLKQKAWKKKPALWLAWRKYCNEALFLRALNADEALCLKQLSLTAPMAIFPNGVFPEHYEHLPEPGEFIAKFPQLQGRQFVLFLSRLHYKKGLDYLIEAFAIVASRTHDIDLVVAGPDDGVLAQLEQDIQRLRLTNRVHVIGPLYGRDKLAALVDAACFCLPSRQEGFSNAITEALACATPVVISEHCNFPEVGEVCAGAIVPLNAARTASALLELLQSPTLRERAGRAGRKLVMERFNWHAIAADTISRIEQLTHAMPVKPAASHVRLS